ncbi:hypothetical protein CR513_06616, partial [Mucuna pruriens]
MQELHRERLMSTLRNHADLFTWQPFDMLGIDPNDICHHLALCTKAKPVSYTTWLSNVVLVKKHNRKWWMCIDYSDLNKACPKDSYPLPSIDRLVNKAWDFQVLSFLDAYSDYNQIQMYPFDVDKIAFRLNEPTYCYQFMSFGLKM